MSVSARGTSRYVEAWDPRKLETPVSSKHIDSSAGQLYPYYDQGMQTAFIVGKGDSTLRTYEVKFDASAVVTLTRAAITPPTRQGQIRHGLAWQCFLRLRAIFRLCSVPAC